MTAPFAATIVRGMAQTMDASGGNANLVVNLDPRFCSLISFVTVQLQQATSADADVVMEIAGATIPTIIDSRVVVAVASLVSTQEIAVTFAPPPIVIPGGGEAPGLKVTALNVTNDVIFLDAQIYLFNIRVRELMPMGPLLWARGAT